MPPAKCVYQLQEELDNILMWERENVISYATRTKESTDRVGDAHKLANYCATDDVLKPNSEDGVIKCSRRALRSG